MTTPRFARFVGIDWSGAAMARPPGLALAEVTATGAARLVRPVGGWSRGAILDRLLAIASAGERVLIGIDFSAAFPFADAGGYFPGEAWSPRDAPALWALVEAICADDPHLGASSFPRHAAQHFRRQERGEVLTGATFVRPAGRLRLCEARTRALRLGHAVSSFNLIGAAQVGRSSLTGMRMLHRHMPAQPVWPFDSIPDSGPLIVEVYSTIAACAAGLTAGRSKVRDAATLAAAMARLGSVAPVLDRHDDHSGDALMIAAWLRGAAEHDALWSPPLLTPRLAATEGWTFGVP